MGTQDGIFSTISSGICKISGSGLLWFNWKLFLYLGRILDCWDANAAYNECGTICEQKSQCGKPHETCGMFVLGCSSGCFCKSGFIKDYRRRIFSTVQASVSNLTP